MILHQWYGRAVLILMAVLVLPALAWAEERIESIETTLTLDENGALTVRQAITAFAEGGEIKRGIFFELPQRLGRLSDFTVTRNGRAEPFDLVGDDDETLRIGDRDVFLETGRHDYVVTYRAERPFWRRDDGRIRLSWTPLAGQFELPWRTARLTIGWPRGLGPDGASAEQYERIWRGPIGTADDGEAFESGAIVLTWPGETFPESAIRYARVNELLRYWALISFAFLWAYLHLSWMSVGRDTKPTGVSASSTPPAGLSPAASRYVTRMGFDMTAFVAALVSLVTKRAITLERDDKSLTIAKSTGPRAELSPGERALAGALFDNGDSVTLKPGDSRIGKASGALRRALRKEYRERYFTDNKAVWQRFWILFFAVEAALIYLFVQEVLEDPRDRVALILAIMAFVLSPFLILIYVQVMRAPTWAGRLVRDQIEGLRRYLSAEDPLPARRALPAHFFELLAYAVALDAEEAWAARFGPDLEEADDLDVQALFDWYKSLKYRDDGTSTMTAAILPAITTQSTGSGASSGGFSGGGGASAGGW